LIDVIQIKGTYNTSDSGTYTIYFTSTLLAFDI